MEDSVNENPNPTPAGWGLRPPAEYVGVRWGARAIYKLHSVTEQHRQRYGGKYRNVSKQKTVAEIDILPDRQAMLDGTEEERQALAAWYNKTGARLLEKRCLAEYLTGDSDDSVTIDEGGYRLVASPRASYGYLYVGVWKL